MTAGIFDYALDKHGKINLKVVTGDAVLGVSDLPIAHPVIHIRF